MPTKLNEYKIVAVTSTQCGTDTRLYLLLKNKYISAVVQTSLLGNEYNYTIKTIIKLKDKVCTFQTLNSIHNKDTQKMIPYSIDAPTKTKGIYYSSVIYGRMYKYRTHKDAVKQYIKFALEVSD
jgi:hypothetical protein